MLQFVIVAATLIGLYRQLRAQRAASLYEQSSAWNREWSEEHLSVSRLAFMIDLEGRQAESGLPASGAETNDYFERLGYLVGQGHLRPSDIWNDMRIPIGRWWSLTEPYIRHERATSGNFSLYEWFEGLELEMARLDRKMLGKELTFESWAADLPRLIDGATARLQLHANARSGIFPQRRIEPAQRSDGAATTRELEVST